VDFQLTALQEELRDTTRKLCTGRFPVAASRAAGGRVDSAGWIELVDAGVFDLRRSEDAGGLGLGTTDAAVVFEELGRGLVPGPLVWSHLAAGILPAAVVGGIERPPAGAPVLVEHLGDLEALVVLDGEGVWVVDPDLVAARPLAPFDPLTPVWALAGLPRGERVGSADEAARWRLDGAALTAAMLAGVAAGACESTVAYARERRQFGRPVGSFQAVKHALADMLVRAEMARVQAYAAAAHVDEPDVADTVRAVAAAKLVAGDAALQNGKAAIQLHGGMGMTWEVDSHLYLKRAWVLDASFGAADAQAEAVALRVLR
jgi:alkylation response protein AidB-like acyl-CoA dehydrogenase